LIRFYYTLFVTVISLLVVGSCSETERAPRKDSKQSGYSSSNSISSYRSKSNENERDLSLKAFVTAEMYVETKLVSSTTAKFARYRGHDGGQVTRLGKDEYRVQSYVDSQNRYGAMIRTNYSVTVHFLNGRPDRVSDLKMW